MNELAVSPFDDCTRQRDDECHVGVDGITKQHIAVFVCQEIGCIGKHAGVPPGYPATLGLPSIRAS